jgi:hypothetical protein
LIFCVRIISHYDLSPDLGRGAFGVEITLIEPGVARMRPAA